MVRRAGAAAARVDRSERHLQRDAAFVPSLRQFPKELISLAAASGLRTTL